MITSIICWAITLSYLGAFLYVFYNYGLTLTNSIFIILLGFVVLQIMRRLHAREEAKNTRYIDLT